MRYHFVLTVQWTSPTGAYLQTQDGTVDFQPGLTRTDVLKHLLEQMREGRPGAPIIMFFSLDPDEIRAA